MTLFDKMPVGMTVTYFPSDDPREGYLIAANAAASRNIGIDLSEYIGLPAADSGADVGIDSSEQEATAVMAFEVAVTGKSQSFAAYELESGPAQGRYEASIFRIGDRTAATVFRRTDAEVVAGKALDWAMRSLESSNAQLSQFASTVAHDLKNPLAGISGNAEILEMTTADLPAEALVATRRIRELANLSSEMVDGLLNFSRSSELDATPAADEVDLRLDVVDWVVSLLEEQIDATGVVIEVDELPRVRGNRAALRQVFQNLISNAIRFRSNERACVILLTSAETATGEVRVQVCDNGLGISVESQEEIFEWGYSSNRSRSTTGGHGLGLAACRTVLRSLGADISVADSPAQPGTVMEIRFRKA